MNTFNADDDVYEEMRPVHVECDKPARIPAELNCLKRTRIRCIFLSTSPAQLLPLSAKVCGHVVCCRCSGSDEGFCRGLSGFSAVVGLETAQK